MLEQAAGVQFFERTAHGLIATRAARQLAQAARLAFAEMDQAEADLAAMAGREVGSMVIGALPLSRSRLLPAAMLRFRETRPGFSFDVIDGRYEELLAGLRRGEIDMMIGALRMPVPVDDVAQERFFDDSVVVVARQDHPLTRRKTLRAEDLTDYPWVIAREGTPLRAALESVLPGEVIRNGISTSSVMLMRELLSGSDYLAAVSCLHISGEAESLAVLPVDLPCSSRAIGITTRAGWEPTAAQRAFLDLIGEEAAKLRWAYLPDS